MKIVVDLQSCQNLSRNRGIGRYSLSLARAMAKVGTEHEFWIALSAFFPETVDSLRSAFRGLVPPERIVVWHGPGPVMGCDSKNDWRRETAELIREEFIADLRPDVVHVTSLFEGCSDNVVTSIGEAPSKSFTAVTLYDLIPLIYANTYLEAPQSRAWYQRKLQSFKNADIWLAISEHTRQDAIERLALPADRVVNVGAGVDPRFRQLNLDQPTATRIRQRHGLNRPFVLYTGGIEFRKNIDGLIQAFSLLPQKIRDRYQLAVVCRVQEQEKTRLRAISRKLGLGSEDAIFTGFVSDDDLIALYNLCHLFVFPSLYEGFGLPALEGMACGAPVIAANASSLPEVVGWEKALFDPRDPQAIAAKMQEALTDEGFRDALKKHGLEQAKRFSWEETARRALAAFRAALEGRAKAWPRVAKSQASKPRLAYVSPLPPVKSGIADYSRELLPDLASYYRIELIADQPEVADPWLSASFPVRTPEWFAENGDRFDRFLYHFGNSEFHKYMFGLLRSRPGAVVLHDFYLSGVLHWMELTGYAPGAFRRELYRSHGYGALAELDKQGVEAVVWRYPCSRSVLEGSNGVLVHSHHAIALAEKWYGPGAARAWRLVPQPRAIFSSERAAARSRLGFRDEEFVVCSFGFLAPTKLPELLVEAWLAAAAACPGRWRLIFVGGVLDERLAATLKAVVRGERRAQDVAFTGYLSQELYESYLSAADVAVQLRTNSRGETSKAVLDCLAAGIPTIVNAHGWMAELPDSAVLKLSDPVDVRGLVAALAKVCINRDFRRGFGAAGQQHIETVHAPSRVAEAYFQALEGFAGTGPHSRRRRLIRAIAENGSGPRPSDADLAATAIAIARNDHERPPRPQMLLGVSVLAEKDAGTGIKRVTRALLKQLVFRSTGLRCEPVTADLLVGYRYARQFTQSYFGLPLLNLRDDPVELKSGDVFLGVDLEAHLVPRLLPFFSLMRLQGVRVYFVCYDLLPLRHPEWFPEELCPLFMSWLEAIVRVADGVVCISRTVADQLFEWVQTGVVERALPLNIGYFYLGADAESAAVPGDDHVPEEIERGLSRGTPTFLMVGTVEPRKGYGQVLEAFEQLWRQNRDVRLVIVGKQGWMMERLVDRVRRHPALGTRLFWLERAGDDTLTHLYRRSTALLMASQDEGFGLPLVEAARHGLPVIARDIPVFREVCGDHAFYFAGGPPESLAAAINQWLTLAERNGIPSAKGISWLRWEQSAQMLLDVIFEGKWHRVWDGCSSDVETVNGPTGKHIGNQFQRR
jgi:glycosyltransferase involved in cell wall biosynthesis